MYLSSLTLSILHFFVSATQTFHNVALCNHCLLVLHKFSLVSHTKGQDHAQAPKPTQPTCTPPQGLVLVGAPRLRSYKENDRQTEPPTDARSMASAAVRLTLHSQRPRCILHPSALCKARGPAAPTSLPRAATSSRRAAAAGAELKRWQLWAPRRELPGGWSGARCGLRLRDAAGPERGDRCVGAALPWARPRLCKSPGRTPLSPLEWAGLREGWAQGCSRDPAAVAAPAGLSSPRMLPPGGRETEAVEGSASSWLLGPPADSSYARCG